MRFSMGFSALVAGALASTSPAAIPPRPKLVVAISIDQFSAELFGRYRSTYAQGLKRLSDGITFTGYQSHGGTETCPGHSTLLTGRHPSGTGIPANDWTERQNWSEVYCVTVPGADKDARGPQNLRASTFGEWLKQAEPGARVVSISGKDRAAIMMGGHKVDAVYWWQDGKGFTTSSYAGPATPEVTDPADRFNAGMMKDWSRHAPQLWPAGSPAVCQSLMKQETFGRITRSGRIPPDQASAAMRAPDYLSTTGFQDQLRASPMLDTLVLDFARRVARQRRLGKGPATDLLALSFSATDSIGHRYGNGGPEECAQVAALDRTLGALFAQLDGLHVPYVVVLSADHGGFDAAERAKARFPDAYRLDSGAFRKAMVPALSGTLGIADPVSASDIQQIYIKAAPGSADFTRTEQAAIAWLKTRPEVAAAYTRAEVAAAVPPKGKPVTDLTLLERFNESFVPDRSGDIFIAFKPHASFGIPATPTASVAGHGSPWDYDRQVPMLFWWRGVTPDQRSEPVETVDIAPTLAAITGVPVPQVDGKCLPQVAGECR
ncbi:alkaline phosphatase family protein [uncultured Sphingomonas sp.]|uniref:alkaline phosphatase family protein n=1 Tax=uncultured Sphingomonas sp. TaxID=158754 RepID=UPI0025EB011B|nr:alkaline phosphatase family protein [uncultured Sphingomonas sp.]